MTCTKSNVPQHELSITTWDNDTNLFVYTKQLPPKMPRTSSADSMLVKKAVDFLIKFSKLTVLQAMQLAGFTKDERNNCSHQRLILCHLPGKRKGDLAADETIPDHQGITIDITGKGTVSLITDSSSNYAAASSASPSTAPPP